MISKQDKLSYEQYLDLKKVEEGARYILSCILLSLIFRIKKRIQRLEFKRIQEEPVLGKIQ